MLVCKMAGANQSEDDGKEYEAVEEAEDNHEKEHFEEDNKRIVVGGCQQNYGKKCGQSAIEDGWTYL